MKDGMSSFDVLAVTAELRALVGGFVDKAYQKDDELILKVNMPGVGRREAYARVGKWLCLREMPEKPETPPPFATTLRKHLDNARIVAVEQRGFDPVGTFALDRGTRPRFHPVGKGNVAVVGDARIPSAVHPPTIAQAVLEEGAPVDVTPIPLNQHEGRERKPFPTFSEALTFFLDHGPAPPTPVDEATAKLRRRIEQQEATLRELREDSIRAGALAELVFAHFARFDELIQQARDGRLEVGGAVIAVDPERHRARVAVGDAAEFEIDWTRDVQGNAHLLYERRRDALEKAEKVAVAIEETQQQLQSAAKRAAKAVARPRVKATKSFWFE